MSDGGIIELAVEVDSEAAEAVSELFNRYNGGTYEDDSAAGEASGGGAVVVATGFDDFSQPIDGEYRLVVKTYLKSGKRGDEIRRQIEEGLWHLSRIYPIPEATVRVVREEDWAHAWKQFYRPMRIGTRIVLKPPWEAFAVETDDIVVELEPGMAFGTGMHPSTRLCVAALERYVARGDHVLDVGTGSGVLSIVAAKLGAARVRATDIDPVAVKVARENIEANDLGPGCHVTVEQGSVPADANGEFAVVVANILAEVLIGLLDGTYGNASLSAPLAEDGVLIMAGILAEKAEGVLEAADRRGLSCLEKLQEDDWVALVVGRTADRIARENGAETS